MNKRMLVFLLLLFVGIWGIYVPVCSANMSVEPSKYEGTIPPGGMSSNKYYITNNYSIPITVIVEWNDQTINPKNSTWLRFENTEVTVEPKKTGTIDFSIHIPEEAEGLYYARVRFLNKVDPGAQGVLSINYNFPLRIIVDGTENYKYFIEKVQLSNDSSFQCSMLLSNPGNVHVYVDGSIEIVGEDGTRYTSPCKIPQAGLVLPQKSLACTANMDMILPDGNYTLTMSYEAGDDKSLTCSVSLEFSVQDGKVSPQEIDLPSE